VEIRDLDPADLDAAFDIRNRSFGIIPDSSRDGWERMVRRSLDDHRVLGAYDDRQLLGVARINQFSQWWQGRSLPMAGIGGVTVAPEARGTGVGRQLMLRILQRSADQGYPLSALYPATVPLYRSCGWEIAGAQHVVTVPTEALRQLSATRIPVRRLGPDDAGQIVEVVRRIHTAARSSGPIDWDPADVRIWLEEDKPFAYLAEDGFLAYGWDDRDLEVEELVAGSEQAARALWSLVGSGSSIAETVKACIGPTDPLRWLIRESSVRPHKENRWMLRLVDVPAALAGRGYPAGVAADVTLTVDDPQLPANTGTWRVAVAKGTGTVEPASGPLEPASGGGVRLGPRGLAALYAGTPLPTLRLAGLVTGGDPDTDALLDTVFAAQPYMVDYF
jgi:predicted acetyltransferase